LAAGDGPIQNDAVTYTHMVYVSAHFPHDSRAFVAHDEGALPAQGGVVGMANAGGFNFNENLSGIG
jgi:hypothetical protein